MGSPILLKIQSRLKKYTWPAYLALFLVLAVSVLQWVILTTENPVLTKIPYWFFQFRKHELSLWGGYLFPALLLLSTFFILHSNGKSWQKLIFFFGIGAALQFSIGFSNGEGTDGIRRNIVTSGHAEFVPAAFEFGIWECLTDYENLVKADSLCKYAKSKPPGVQLFYNLNAQWINWRYKEPNFKKIEHFKDFVLWFWPLLCMLCIAPLYLIGKMLWNKNAAFIAVALFIWTPAIQLTTLHTDQVIFPFLFLMPLLMAAWGLKNNMDWALFLAGVLCVFALFFSFGLVFCIPFCLLFFIHFHFIESEKIQLRKTSKTLFWFLCGLAFALLAEKWMLNYDIISMYDFARNNHIQWRGWEGNSLELKNSILTNFLEFSLYIGFGFSLLFLLAFGYFTFQFVKNRKIPEGFLLAFGIVCILIFLLLAGKTKGETMRLWLFLVPVMGLSLAHLFRKEKGEVNFLLFGFLTLQCITLILLKMHQDF